MPELPEVETLVRGIRDQVVGSVIEEVVLKTPSIVGHDPLFTGKVKGKTIVDVHRRGKYIWIGLDVGVLLVHLRMTGKLLFQAEVGPYDHIWFRFTNRNWMLYRDVRKFGRVLHFETPIEAQSYLEDRIGREPLELDEVGFLELLGRRHGSIKSVLLDQRIIAGIGNIYADEILFASRVHPKTAVDALHKSELRRIHTQMTLILQTAIQAGGSTVRDYTDGNGQRGSFQDTHRVYGRAHLNCLTCGKVLEKTIAGGRTTVYCPICQKRR